MTGFWFNRHTSDYYVKKSKLDGYFSRAAYKLLEIQKMDKFIKKGMNVLDLGSAPGSWSQVSREIVGDSGKVIAVDISPMKYVSGVKFIRGNFFLEEIVSKIVKLMNRKFDVVISDMSPNLSGIKYVDQKRSADLINKSLDNLKSVLCPGGNFLVKVFQGEDFHNLKKKIDNNFYKTLTRKPNVSRSSSSEFYLLCLGYSPKAV